ncbi:AAA family ATPase [Bacteriovoracaceae bacterium]|nr:AAA family ATPase [Bacteriovoracaceae bacterium]
METSKLSHSDRDEIRNLIIAVIDSSKDYLFGKKEQITISTLALLTGRHILLEDRPGMGKTTLVSYMAKILNLSTGRVQFTSDLLPSDIIGTSIFSSKEDQFKFRAGPIFNDLILADEINRAPPKTQSALLQAMEEKSIDIDNETYDLSSKFIVFATQNPFGQIGTYPLPESQLDRFGVKLDMGEMNFEQFDSLIQEENIREKINKIESRYTMTDIKYYLNVIEQIHFSSKISEYIFQLYQYTINNEEFVPLSIRACQDLKTLSQAYALLHKREFVVLDDIQYLFPYVCSHRISNSSQLNRKEEIKHARQVLDHVKTP